MVRVQQPARLAQPDNTAQTVPFCCLFRKINAWFGQGNCVRRIAIHAGRSMLRPYIYPERIHNSDAIALGLGYPDAAKPSYHLYNGTGLAHSTGTSDVE